MNDRTEEPEMRGKALPLKPILIRVDEFQVLLGCGRTKAFDMLRTGKVRSILMGRSRRVLLADAEQYVADALMEQGQ